MTGLTTEEETLRYYIALIRLPVMKIECLGLSWQLNLIAPYQFSIGLQSSEISVGVDIQSEMTEYIA